MLILYSAVPANVKGQHFEVFWVSHHVFIVFFIGLILHGADWLSPRFQYFLPFPLLLYVTERVFREVSSRKAVSLLSVTHMDKVFTLEMDRTGPWKKDYKEGQYAFLMCPFVSETEWHPFTISSAPQEESVTFHIRKMGEGSWTEQVAEYMRLLSPPGSKAFCQMTHVEGSGAVAGKITGPDGKPLFRVHGPLSAPTQHLAEYEVDMVVASGIGVTPLAASLNSIVQHRWRLYIGRTFPDDATFYWMCSHRDIPSFRWMCRIIKEAQDTVCDLRVKQAQAMRRKFFQIHIFITSAPKNKAFEPVVVPADEQVYWGRARQVGLLHVFLFIQSRLLSSI
jgi:hypothetical protein